MQFKPLKIILVLTLLSGAALFLISNLLNYSHDQIIEQIEKNLKTESLSLQDNFRDIKAIVANESFDLTSSIYPTFLYKHNQLVAWSDYRFEPNELLVEKNNDINIAKVDNSLVVYKKDVVNADSSDYMLITFFPIETGYAFHNQYLSNKLNIHVIPNGVKLSKNGTVPESLKIFFDSKFFFNVVPSSQNIYSQNTDSVIQILTVLFTVGLFLSIFLLSLQIAHANQKVMGFGVLVGLIGTARILMILFNYPNAYLNADLFRSRIFVSSAINSSIGDLFLNNISLLIISVFLVLNKDWLLEKTMNIFSSRIRNTILMFAVLLSFFLLQRYFDLVFDLLSNAQIKLDISENVSFSWLAIAAYLSILIFGISYFFLCDIIFKVINNWIKDSRQWITLFLIGSSFFAIISIATEGVFLVVLFLQSIYINLLYYGKLSIRLGALKFTTFLYVLTVIFLLAAAASFAVYQSYEFKELTKKEKFGTKLLIDRDVEGEYLLKELMNDIKSDAFINSSFVNPQSSKELIRDRITRQFSYGYFENYNVNTVLFDKDGKAFDRNAAASNFSVIKSSFDDIRFKTDFDDIYFQSEGATLGRRRYLCFIDLERYENHTGSILLDLRLKKKTSKSVYPELLLEHQFIGRNTFDYAIYNQQGLAYNVGNFNYSIKFDENLLSKDKLFETGLEVDGYHHLGIRGENKFIIISSEVYSNWAVLSNFSFYFLLSLLTGILILSFSSLWTRKSSGSVSFSTKILIYIGCAFALPIVFVGFAIINTINTSYKSEIEKSYEKKTTSIGENIIGLIEGYHSNIENREGITNEISKTSRTARADINIYNKQGKLISTSQPKVFESGLLSSYVNPVAFHQIRNGKRDKLILDESIGNLTYKSSYIAIRAFEDGELLGIMSSPFFGSKNHLNRQKTEIFNNIINITTLIFIFSIWFTYLAVRRLTNPLIVIASKLKRTELKEENEPLEWKTNDEVGVLIQEYNKMVEKLEVSKKELAKNEKEAAWREMAKQVAHEIKNPLTPMKLTLQHLDRVMDEGDKRRKSLNTLLSQVDTLDEIVTSFSHFAKMPDPENVDFDIKLALEKIIHLHPEKNILIEDSASEYMVHADKKLFGRIFNNIVLNAFQAMVNIENPQLKVTLANKRGKILISFKDNGSGISEEIRDKIFIPNFSTKDSGSGIGLAVAKRGIEHAGGTIYFESQIGGGTTFFVELKLIMNSDKSD